VSHTELRHPQLHLLPNVTLTILVAQEVLTPDILCPRFVSHTELRHPQLHLLPNDTLTILCEISISGDNFVTCGTTKSVPFCLKY
jgi:hypothetical protein